MSRLRDWRFFSKLAKVAGSPGRRRGQIATFLLLLVVVVLIFAMATANLGQVSATATTVANATDASALYLGSLLASRSHFLCKQLSGKLDEDKDAACDPGEKGKKFCQTGGWLLRYAGYIGAAIAAAFGQYWAIGIAAGAQAGANFAMAADSKWSAAALGAFEGFMIGATMGRGLGLGKATAALKGWEMGIAIGGIGTDLTVKGIEEARLFDPLTSVAQTFSGVLPEGQKGQKTTLTQVRAHVQSLSSLPVLEQTRESVLLQAHSRLVDDPNTTLRPDGTGGCYFPDFDPAAVGDPFDTDGDGDRTDPISCLDYWWGSRLNALYTALNGPTNVMADLIRQFIEGPWNGRVEGTVKDRRDKARRLLEFLERHEVECDCQQGGAIVSEGPTVQLWRRLAGAGYSFPAIFQPGPSQSELRSFLEGSPQSLPAGWDSVDSVQLAYDQFLAWADFVVYSPVFQGRLGFASSDAWYRHLAEHPEKWLPGLYDPDSTDDWHDRLEFIRGEIDRWVVTARDTVVRDQLPLCHLAYGDYPVVVSRQEKDPPFCEHRLIGTDPDGQLSADIDPIYNCTWQVDASRTATGVHLANEDFNPDFSGTFPGPICKINLNRRTALAAQLDAIEAFVKDPNLENRITDDPAEHFDNAECDDGDDRLEDAGDMVLDSIDAAGVLQWKNGARISPGEFVYTYKYTYECQACTTDPITDIVTCDDWYERQVQQTKTPPANGVDSIHIPIMARADLLDGAVNGMRAKLTEIEGTEGLDNGRRIFGTTDADFDDEFTEGVGGEVFLNHAEPDGAAAVGYFLKQVEAFIGQYNTIQASRPVQPAVHGGLPNAEQAIFDPISGATRPVDGRYAWRDSRGSHEIQVEMSRFVLPDTRVTETSYFFGAVRRKCLELINSCANTPDCPNQWYSLGPVFKTSGSGRVTPTTPKYRLDGSIERPWVRITKKDPTDQASGFWQWNPFAGTIRQRAQVCYDRLAVGLTSGEGSTACTPSRPRRPSVRPPKGGNEE